jgi:hypothetical protein
MIASLLGSELDLTSYQVEDSEAKDDDQEVQVDEETDEDQESE